MEISAGTRSNLMYGQEKVADGVAGVEFLGANKTDEDDEHAWDEASDEKSTDDEEQGWVNVSHGPEMAIAPMKKKRRASKRTADAEQEDSEVNEEIASDSDDEEWVEDEWIVDEDENEEEASDEDIDSDSKTMDDLVRATSDESSPLDEPAGALTSTDRIETMRILTPADFALMKKLRQQAEAERITHGKASTVPSKRERSPSPSQDENVVDTSVIEGHLKKRKQTKEERIASIEEGRKDRPKFGSRKGKDRGSITNKVRLHV